MSAGGCRGDFYHSRFGEIAKINGAKGGIPTFSGGNANFAPNPPMHVEGEVGFNGAATDPIVGWQVGWIQAQWVETNWGNYKGQASRRRQHVPAARPSSRRAAQGCRDTSGLVGTTFTDPTDPKEFQPLTGPFPKTVKVQRVTILRAKTTG